MSFLKTPFFKKLLLYFLTPLSILVALCLIRYGTRVQLPTDEKSILFYSTQKQQDLKLTYIEAIQKAKKKITLATFTLKDPHVIAWLNKKVNEGVEVTLYYDQNHNGEVINELDQRIKAFPYQHSALMHRKLLITDDQMVILGSANFTTNSLWEDDNLCNAIFDESVATWFEKHLMHYDLRGNFHIKDVNVSCFLTPDRKREGIEKVLQIITKAEKKIQIAMYSFTHPEILKALVAAKEKGVEVEIFLDRRMKFQNTLRKQKAYEALKSSIKFGRKKTLLHHKCALIDEKIFIMGSTNWTQAGFLKNQDFLIVYESLDHKHIAYLQSIFKLLRMNTT